MDTNMKLMLISFVNFIIVFWDGCSPDFNLLTFGLPLLWSDK